MADLLRISAIVSGNLTITIFVSNYARKIVLNGVNALPDTNAASFSFADLTATTARNATASAGDNDLFGLNGNDTLTGNSGEDRLFGGGGADTLDGKGDIDFAYGGAGADTLVAGGGTDSYMAKLALISSRHRVRLEPAQPRIFRAPAATATR